MPGYDDNLGMRREFECFFERREALVHAFRIRWKTKILQYDQGFVAAQFGDGRGSVLCSYNIVVLKTPFQLAEESGVILDDQEFSFVLAQRSPLFQRSLTKPAGAASCTLCTYVAEHMDMR